MRTTSQTKSPDGLVSVLAARVAGARRWLAGGFNRGQLGPGHEAEWRSFRPRPR